MLNGVHNCDVLFVNRTGTGDARTQDLALAANSEPPHQSEHVAVVPGGCWEQEPGDEPPVAWSQWQGHWGQQWQVSALQTDKLSGVEPMHARWEACVNSPTRDMALVLLMSCLELPNVELHDHQMAFVYPNFVMLSCMTIRWYLFIPLFTFKIRGSVSW